MYGGPPIRRRMNPRGSLRNLHLFDLPNRHAERPMGERPQTAMPRAGSGCTWGAGPRLTAAAGRTGRVTHWRSGEMMLRWAAAAALQTEKSFRKIPGRAGIGYRDLLLPRASRPLGRYGSRRHSLLWTAMRIGADRQHVPPAAHRKPSQPVPWSAAMGAQGEPAGAGSCRHSGPRPQTTLARQ